MNLLILFFLVVFDYLFSLPLFLNFIINYPDEDSLAISWLMIFCCWNIKAIDNGSVEQFFPLELTAFTTYCASLFRYSHNNILSNVSLRNCPMCLFANGKLNHYYSIRVKLGIIILTWIILEYLSLERLLSLVVSWQQ